MAFDYRRVATLAEARAALRERADARLIAGGTTVLDLIKAGVDDPGMLVDISRVPLARIEGNSERIRIGALARNSDVALDPDIAREFPMLSQALLAGASAQLRNMATIGGNVLQRTRCSYFRDTSARCNKRDPGAGCEAIGGYDRGHALLGTSAACIATHASDMCVALAALNAVIVIEGDDGERHVSLADFYRLPGDQPQMETDLRAHDVIVAVEIERAPEHRHSTYVKLRDRASYEFALVSVAAGLEITGGVIRNARIALGGVGTIPWRPHAAETLLEGRAPSAALFAEVADAALDGAVAGTHNGFKIELAKRAIVRALDTLGEHA